MTKLLLVIFLLPLLFCTHSSKKTSLLDSPLYQLSYYNFVAKEPVINRIKSFSEKKLNKLKDWDMSDDYLNYMPTDEEKKIIKSVFENLPPVHRKFLQERVVALYFIENLRSSAITDWVFDKDKTPYFYITIKAKSINWTSSQIMNYRLSSLFNYSNSDTSIYLDAGNESALYYSYLHEISHVLDGIFMYTPLMDPGVRDVIDSLTEATEYVKSFWESRKKTLPEHDYKLRSQLNYYGFSGKRKFQIAEAHELLSQFKKGPFSTIYGSKAWGEDFADMLMLYHMTVKMNNPFKYVLKKGDDILLEYEPHKNPKVMKRMKFMERFYQ